MKLVNREVPSLALGSGGNTKMVIYRSPANSSMKAKEPSARQAVQEPHSGFNDADDLQRANVERTNVICKVFDIGMEIYANHWATRFPCIYSYGMLHVDIFEIVSDPAEWLTSRKITSMTSIALISLEDQLSDIEDYGIFDVRRRKNVRVDDFCVDQVLREDFQMYLVGKCANARFSGAGFLSFCAHFVVLFAESDARSDVAVCGYHHEEYDVVKRHDTSSERAPLQ